MVKEVNPRKEWHPSLHLVVVAIEKRSLLVTFDDSHQITGYHRIGITVKLFFNGPADLGSIPG